MPQTLTASSSTSPTLKAHMRAMGHAARQAARALAQISSSAKNVALFAVAEALEREAPRLIRINTTDVDAARAVGIDAALLDRLRLDQKTIAAMAEGLRQIAELPDPVGQISQMSARPNGLQIGRMRVPIGVVGFIYESRPNVTADAAALCLKSGNAVILRGGSDAHRSNLAILHCIHEGLRAARLPQDIVQMPDTIDRNVVGEMITMSEYIDVIIPRGGRSLIERIDREARIPVIKHLDGVCHVYVDETADVEMAIRIADNAKTQRYGTCNTMETLLLHQAIAPDVLPPLARIYQQKGVQLRCCPESSDILLNAGLPRPCEASEADWGMEYLAPILSVRVVENDAAAIEHINHYGSHHTDAIITEHLSIARRFLREVDSASVLVNASTRFADGYEYGLGAEIGISTNKLHARGPVGLEGLTSQKWVVLGSGQVRE